MACFKMPKVPSLMFDIELEEGWGQSGEHQPAELRVVVSHLRSLLQPGGNRQKQLTLIARQALARSVTPSVWDLAKDLASHGHHVRVRHTAPPAGIPRSSTECLKNLRHSFIVCTPPGRSDTFIVDPEFREQFVIANPTERYSALIGALPDVFVGTEEDVLCVVEFMCREMGLAFSQSGALLPPWRQAVAMMSKWRPRVSEDVPVETTLARSSPEEHAGHIAMGASPQGQRRDGEAGNRNVQAARRSSFFLGSEEMRGRQECPMRGSNAEATVAGGLSPASQGQLAMQLRQGSKDSACSDQSVEMLTPQSRGSRGRPEGLTSGQSLLRTATPMGANSEPIVHRVCPQVGSSGLYQAPVLSTAGNVSSGTGSGGAYGATSCAMLIGQPRR